jgi:diguanylate cyclase (GGDEF)-like protein
LKNTILIVDDSGTNIDILIGLLGDAYDIVVATNGIEAMEITQSDTVDLVLLDIMMPQMDGYEVCAKLKADTKTKDIPVIFVTAKNDEDSIEKAYDCGGVDYVTKPFKAREIQARIKTHLKLQNSLKELAYLASMDSMTGIYNRRMFFEIANETMRNIDSDYYAVMVDLDHFKTVNDTYGHHVGDEVLKATVNFINKELGKNEFMGRLGGEEFAVIMYENSAQKLMTRLEKIKTAIEDFSLRLSDGAKVSITASFGVAKYDKRYVNIDKFLSSADDALYDAKKEGRNAISFSDF